MSAKKKRSHTQSNKKLPPFHFQSELEFLTTFPSKNELPESSLLIVDANLLRYPVVKRWLQQFSFVYPIKAGEELKQLQSFEKHLKNILKLTQTIPSNPLTFVAIGGGSVGDFVGFLASTFKRGVPLIQIPSTWLAAIDSSHGGKTALNIGIFKNQIGTFYPAQKVILCRPLLLTQPMERTQEAMGEILKTALLAGGPLWKKMSNEKQFDSQKLWNYLPLLIAYKYKIVLKDPFEKKGLRHVLNLGHTFGHIFELQFRLPHGQAVNLGLLMCLQLSEAKGIMSAQKFKALLETPLLKYHLAKLTDLKPLLKNNKNILDLLAQDKKVSKNKNIRFVYLISPGKPTVIETSLKELAHFALQLSS